MKNKKEKICIRCGYTPIRGEYRGGGCYVYHTKVGNRHDYSKPSEENDDVIGLAYAKAMLK